MRPVIPEALKLIQRTEKRWLKPYQGGADKPGVITIGDGHVISPGEQWMLKGITAAQADEIFAKDVAKHAEHIEQEAGVPLDDYEYGALASFYYNLGPHALLIAPSVTTLLKAGKKREAFWKLYQFCNSDSQYRDGLFYRRLTEIALALTKKLVAKPDNCVQARQHMADLKLPPVVEGFFSRKHRKDLCQVCKNKR